MNTPYNRKPKKIVLSNSYGNDNVGDQAILISMIDALRNRLPNVEIRVLSRWPEQTLKRHPTIKSVRSGVFRGLLDTSRSIRHADMLIVGGGGVIQDASSFGNLIFHLSRPILALMLGTPFVGCGLGVGPLRNRFGRWLSRVVLNRAESLYVRDDASAALLRQIGVNKTKIAVTADLALTMNFPKKPENQETYQKVLELKQNCGCLIGLSIRPEVSRRGRYGSRSPFFLKLLDDVSKAADELVEKINAHFVFVSMHPEQDDTIVREIQQRLKNKNRITSLSGALNPKVIMATVGLLDLLIGMRLHSLIFAARSCVPMVALSYDPKVPGVCALFGLENQVIPLEQLECGKLVQFVEDTWARREQIRRTLKERLPELKARAERNIDSVVELLGMDKVGKNVAKR